jgi:hypothetical protein
MRPQLQQARDAAADAAAALAASLRLAQAATRALRSGGIGDALRCSLHMFAWHGCAGVAGATRAHDAGARASSAPATGCARRRAARRSTRSPRRTWTGADDRGSRMVRASRR